MKLIYAQPDELNLSYSVNTSMGIANNCMVALAIVDYIYNKLLKKAAGERGVFFRISSFSGFRVVVDRSGRRNAWDDQS